MERLIQTEQTLESQKEILEKVGLWSSPELAAKYRFRLSPDALVLCDAEKEQLEQIADVVYGEGGFLDAAIKLYQKISSLQFRSTQIGSVVIRALTAGIGKKEIPIQEVSSQLPFVCRLDLMRTRDETGTLFKIAEVEGDKTHGFGYLTLVDLFREKFMGRVDTKGIITTLREELSRKGMFSSSPLLLIVGLKERFYINELQAFAKFAQEAGINLLTTLEDKIKINDNGVLINGIEEPIKNLINIPSFTPNGYGQSGIDDEKLFELFKGGKINCLIPPKRFLGSKGLLALVSNGDNSPELEAVLNQVFDPNKLATLRKFIPRTILVTKRNKEFIRKLLEEQPDSWVIKQTMSSGMKGVALTGDDKKERFITEALKNPYNYIIQQKVEQQTRNFRFVEPENLFAMKQADMFMRIELFASREGIATVAVTAREQPSVHGAKDCIQIPVIFGGQNA